MKKKRGVIAQKTRMVQDFGGVVLLEKVGRQWRLGIFPRHCHGENPPAIVREDFLTLDQVGAVLDAFLLGFFLGKQSQKRGDQHGV